jgi:hypothetical protein
VLPRRVGANKLARHDAKRLQQGVAYATYVLNLMAMSVTEFSD